MNAFDNAVDIAAEHARDRETEAAHGGEGREECEAEAYADTLGRLHEAYVFDGMVSMQAGRYLCKTPELHVMPEYFHEHFGDRADIEHEPMPAQSCIRKSVVHSGVKIFCLEDAVFKVVA
mgnify:CR=1 FL=1